MKFVWFHQNGPCGTMDTKHFWTPWRCHYPSIIMTHHQHCRTEIVGEEAFCKISSNWALDPCWTMDPKFLNTLNVQLPHLHYETGRTERPDGETGRRDRTERPGRDRVTWPFWVDMQCAWHGVGWLQALFPKKMNAYLNTDGHRSS